MKFLASSLIAVSSLANPIQKIDFNMTALTPKEVEIKLDSIIVFTPTNKDGTPKSFSFEVNGEKKNIYFAAFSPSAINFLNEKVIVQSSNKDNKFSYSPKSLSKFNSLINIEKEKSKKGVADVIYIPDPDQREISKKLLLEQGYKEDNLDNLLQNNPIVFCPNPTINATDNRNNISYIPCSTDYLTMKGLIDKAKFKKKYFWSKVQKPKVTAIPLTQFINTLRNSDENNIKEIRVLPSPTSIKVINQINQNDQ